MRKPLLLFRIVGLIVNKIDVRLSGLFFVAENLVVIIPGSAFLTNKLEIIRTVMQNITKNPLCLGFGVKIAPNFRWHRDFCFHALFQIFQSFEILIAVAVRFAHVRPQGVFVSCKTFKKVELWLFTAKIP